MLTRKPQLPRGDGNGIVWPGTGTGTPDTVGDVFGVRPFSQHIATVGYDYDFHRGFDIPGTTSFVSPIAGTIVRLNESCFGFETSDQISKFVETDVSSSIVAAHSASNLLLSCSRVGAVALTDAGKLTPRQKMILDDDWIIELKFVTPPSLIGRIGIAVQSTGSQYAAMEYNGSNVYFFGTDSGGAVAVDNTNVAVLTASWIRMEFTSASSTLLWRTSEDGSTWTTRGTDSSVSFTDASIPSWSPRLYYRSQDTDAAIETVHIDEFNFVDGQTVSRFGNWLMISDGRKMFAIMHFESLIVSLGQRVEAGTTLGLAGKTGFDVTSGRVITKHAHVEYLPQTGSVLYSQDTPVNPLNPRYFPRINVSNNVSVTRTTENDPDGVSSVKLDIRITRGDQDFDLNQVSCTGASATRTINWDTRSGLNSNNDIPKNNGVYIVAHDFNENSSEYHVDFFFNISTIGTFASYTILDSQGNTIASG